MILIIFLIIGSLHTKYLLVHLTKYSDEAATNKPEKEFLSETMKRSDYQNWYEKEGHLIKDYQDDSGLSNIIHTHNYL